MRIGILQADHVREGLFPIAGEYPDMFMQLLSGADLSLSFLIYPVIDNKFPYSLDECDAFILTGGRASAYDREEWIANTLAFIRDCHEHRKKLVGICLGLQMAAQALGGLVQKAGQGWGLGVHTFKGVQKQPWMDPVVDSVSMYYSHQDQVVALPENSALLGGTDFCPNSMFTVGSHFLCIQGHPEFCLEFERALIDLRRELISPEKYQEAMDSLNKPVDNAVIAKWIVNFFRYNK